MAKNILSIVIGTECTKVCEVPYKKNYKNKAVRVLRSISFPTPENTIEDGYIKDKHAFGEELKKQLRKANLKSDKVIFSLASSKIANREITIPPVKEKRVVDIITTGASEYFPIDMKEYILSHAVLEKNVSGRKGKAYKKKSYIEEVKLAKKQEKSEKKALKRRSKTEIIADNMELMDMEQELPAADDRNVEETTKTNVPSIEQAKAQMRLLVYAAPASIVKNYYSFAKYMHFDIVALDYSGNSSYQMIKRQARKGTNVFIQFNEQDTLISILHYDVLVLQRTVGYGISTLTDTIIEQDYFNINDVIGAMELLKTQNLFSLDITATSSMASNASKAEAAASSEYDLNDITKELEARQNIRDSLHFLTSSIARMLDYYKSNHKDSTINSIYLTGPGVWIKGIDSFFSSEIGIEHKLTDKLYTVSSSKKATAYRSNPSEFITCIGAVVNPVDFIPKEFVIKKQKRSAILATIIFVIACILGSAVTLYVSYTDYLTAKKELNSITAQYNQMPALMGAHSQYSETEAEYESLLELDRITYSNNDNIKEIIEELEIKLPTGTIIRNMVFSEEGVTMGVTLNDDGTGAYALVAKTLKQLKTISEFGENVNVEGIVVDEEGVFSSVSFTIICKYK